MSLRRLSLSPSHKNNKINEQTITRQKSNGATQETHNNTNDTEYHVTNSMQLDLVMKVTPEKRKRSPTKKNYQQSAIADAMDIDHDVATQDSTKKQTKPNSNLRQHPQKQHQISNTPQNTHHKIKFTTPN